MSASKWMKWLSVIALVLIALETLAVAPNVIMLSGEYSLLILGSIGQQVAMVLLAVVAVIISFKKK